MELKRYKNNPIIKPIDNGWENRATFNPGVIYHEGKVHMVYRAIGELDYYISRLGYATSEDGIHFKRRDKPIFEGIEKFDKWSCEDPRLTKIGKTIYMTYFGVSTPLNAQPPTKFHGATCLASTRNLKTFKRYGPITERLNKDVVLFPKKINDVYYRFARPAKTKAITLGYSKDLINWRDKIFMEPEEGWEKSAIGAGTPPILIKEGWLMFYHGFNKHYQYSTGAVLLDSENPNKIIARTKTPIFLPEESYEEEGDIKSTIKEKGRRIKKKVVFPTGIIKKKDKLYIYYGTSDRYVCLAFLDLKNLSF